MMVYYSISWGIIVSLSPVHNTSVAGGPSHVSRNLGNALELGVVSFQDVFQSLKGPDYEIWSSAFRKLIALL